jgi:hypothetical protein
LVARTHTPQTLKNPRMTQTNLEIAGSARFFSILLDIELFKAFKYQKWDKVLAAFDLKPLEANLGLEEMIDNAGRGGGAGEGEDHRNLKNYIANNPNVIKLYGFKPGKTEQLFPSGDRIDIVFSNEDRWVGVEIKGRSSPNEDLIRGMFQAVKYAALREAYLKSKPQKGKTEVILVMSAKLTPDWTKLRNLLGVIVRDEIVVPNQSLTIAEAELAELQSK